jgi:hypothetical protein
VGGANIVSIKIKRRNQSIPSRYEIALGMSNKMFSKIRSEDYLKKFSKSVHGMGVTVLEFQNEARAGISVQQKLLTTFRFVSFDHDCNFR